MATNISKIECSPVDFFNDIVNMNYTEIKWTSSDIDSGILPFSIAQYKYYIGAVPNKDRCTVDIYDIQNKCLFEIGYSVYYNTPKMLTLECKTLNQTTYNYLIAGYDYLNSKWTEVDPDSKQIISAWSGTYFGLYR